MTTFSAALLQLADEYEAAVLAQGGRSLSRVATIVVSRGSFFDPLRAGQTCSVRNLEKLIDYFAEPENWPAGIPPAAERALASVGRKVAATC